MTPSDAYFLSDSVQLSLANVHEQRTAADSLGFADRIQYRNDPDRILVNDQIGLNDAIIQSVASPLEDNSVDNLLLADVVRLLLNATLVVSDSLSLSDSARLDFDKLPIFSDTLSLSDSFVIRLSTDLTISVHDQFSFSDAVSKQLGTSFTSYLRRFLNDSSN